MQLAAVRIVISSIIEFTIPICAGRKGVHGHGNLSYRSNEVMDLVAFIAAFTDPRILRKGEGDGRF